MQMTKIPLRSAEDVLDRMVQAVELVRQRLRRTTQALEEAKIDYAIVCGNAVAAWVVTIDESAVRNTPDVEVLLRPTDVPAAIDALEAADFQHRTEEGKHWFEDRQRSIPHRHTVRIYLPEDAGLTGADVHQIDRFPGYNVLKLEPLVTLNLVLYRLKHRVHLRDLIDVGLVDNTWPARFHAELADRLQQLLDDSNG
jgi:hypothetical protein